MNILLCMVEGLLEWKEIDWILDGDNRGVVSNLLKYLLIVIIEENKLKYIFMYDNWNIINYIIVCLIEDDVNK